MIVNNALYALLFASLFLFSSAMNNNNTNNTNNTKDELPTYQIYELNDAYFDYYIQNGEKYTWFVIFYLNSSKPCKRAKNEIGKVFTRINETYPHIRFAEIETQKNLLTSTRFNITQIPYIILIHKGKMIELEKFPNEKNLKSFITMNITKRINKFIPIPSKLPFYYIGWLNIYLAINGFRISIQRFLNAKGYSFKIKNYYLVIAGLAGFVMIFVVEFLIISWCFKEEEKAEKDVEEKEKIEEDKRNKEIIATQEGKEDDKNKEEGKEEDKKEKEDKKEEEKEKGEDKKNEDKAKEEENKKDNKNKKKKVE